MGHLGGARLLTSRLARTLAPPKSQTDPLRDSVIQLEANTGKPLTDHGHETIQMDHDFLGLIRHIGND